ncbi:DUF1289 domain-containing protein [Azomonas macrocytogenes]|uniref:DUF1289 domain-containing protein n=1 Tax=Azomonas macrocytogenes TaxID=69962 RepID=UPI003B83493E
MTKHPCVNRCTPSSKACKGCLRTATEIRDWDTYTVEEKLKILEDLEVRKRRYVPDPTACSEVE